MIQKLDMLEIKPGTSTPLAGYSTIGLHASFMTWRCEDCCIQQILQTMQEFQDLGTSK
jgi:hypothetical protein